MAHFQIAGIFELFAVAAGFVLLHKATKEQDTIFLKIAGIVLIAGGILIGLCTAYNSVLYSSAAYSHNCGMMGPGGMRMNPGNMPMGPGGMMQMNPGNMPVGPGGMPMNQGNIPKGPGGMMQGR